MSMGLTSRQRELLQFIRTHFAEKGVAPTFDQMGAFLGLQSKSGVHRLLTALEERGHIRRLPNRARAIALVELKVPTPDLIQAAVATGLSSWARAHGATVNSRMREEISASILKALQLGQGRATHA